MVVILAWRRNSEGSKRINRSERRNFTMRATNDRGATQVDEIADGIYRLATAVELPGGMAFSFNQYLIDDDEPLLFHTGPRRLFGSVREGIARVLPVERLRYVGASHFEADECGALNDLLALAPRATAICSRVAAMVSLDDYAGRPPRPLADGEALPLGRHVVRWLDTPHLPHAWECGLMMETATSTLLCGDLFTQGGRDHPPLTSADILGPSEEMRAAMDYFAHAPGTRSMLERLADLAPTTLACMHGSAYAGDGAALLRALGERLTQEKPWER
jgi:flavorubredoxin